MSEDLEPGGNPTPDAPETGPAGEAVNSVDDARSRIAALEREVRALGDDPEAALLFHEMGLLWEDPLRNPRNASAAFQAAYRIAPRFIENLRAARRIFSDVGNWQLVLQLLDAELEATETGQARAALLYERALSINPALAVNNFVKVAFLYQQLTPSNLSLDQ